MKDSLAESQANLVMFLYWSLAYVLHMRTYRGKAFRQIANVELDELKGHCKS